jgi:phage shock protein A
MKFSINRIVLWPKKEGLAYREIKFEESRINIITGSSRTGKSALIPIIDYCLGAQKCAIPVDVIRNACAWFGVLFDLQEEQILLCRKEPGLKSSSTEMFILRGTGIAIPETIQANTTSEEVKNILNELFSMSFLELDPSSGHVGSARPSYRDFMAFLFQPQNIVANSEVLFYKADTAEHRQRLIDVFPYALGAVTPSVLAARLELESLRKQRDRLQRDIDTLKDVSDSWIHEVTSWISQARELGLTDYEPQENEPFENLVNEIARIVEKNESHAGLTSKKITDINTELVQLRQEERKVSSELFSLQKRQKDMLELQSSIGRYEESLQIQLQRLEISTWLKSLVSDDREDPLLLASNVSAQEEIDSLCSAISEIEKSVGDMSSTPAAFERELHYIGEEIAIHTNRLKSINRRIIEESRAKETDADQKYTLSAMARFLGRLETSLKTYERVGKDSELEMALAGILQRMDELSAVVNESEIIKKQAAAISYINQRIGEIVQGLDAEHPESPVEFIIKDLMLRISHENGRKDYLWEIGSASNWLAYHVATILAFQQFFQKRGKVSVPNFLIFDQPSQVYFPQHRYTELEDEDLPSASDEDKEAVKKVFIAMADFLRRNDNGVQIIVTEHADEDVWGDIESVHLVARWRGADNKLIPSSWL